MRTQHLNKRADVQHVFTRLEVLILLGCLLLLLGVYLPALPARKKAVRVNCVNHLKQVALAFRVFAVEHDGRFPAQVHTNQSGIPIFANPNGAAQMFQILSNDLPSLSVLFCPEDTQRPPPKNLAGGMDNWKVGYFASLTADASQPDQMLAGDRHLRTHLSPTNGLLRINAKDSLRWSAGAQIDQGNIALADGSVQHLHTNTPARHYGDHYWLVFP